jgi:hypothetical protein
MTAAIEGALERLSQQLARGYSAEFREMLAFFARFHTYSWNNSLLIRMQKPDATLVAGLRKWAELGYHVRKGETAIWIWAPIFTRIADEMTGELVEKLTGFRPASVFDASQLANLAEKPLPTPFRSLADDAQTLYRDIRDRIVASGIAIEERSLPPGTEGVSKGGLIVVNSTLDSRRRILVLLHELTHELAHHTPQGPAKTVQQRELEAESVAFVVGAILGIENPNSADYVLNWEGTPLELKASLGTIMSLVRQVLAIVQPLDACRTSEGEPLAA